MEIPCDRWHPELKLRYIVNALRCAKAGLLANKEIHLHCQDLLLTPVAIDLIAELVSCYGIIVTFEYGGFVPNSWLERKPFQYGPSYRRV